MEEKNWFVYLLENTKNNSTYLGVTKDTTKRLKKHNGKLRGGAKYTKSKKGDGEWKYNLIAGGFTKSKAHSIERKAKNMRRKAKGKTPLERRLNVLLPLLNSTKDSDDEESEKPKKKKQNKRRKRKREENSDDEESEKPKKKKRKKKKKKKTERKKKRKEKPPIYFYKKLIKSKNKFLKEHGVEDSSSDEMYDSIFPC
jgi:predicted GIY-YIG superfamily endonuclease